jgi:uncharacterized protein (DUF433 family)
MNEVANSLETVVRTSRGLSIAGTRTTLYNIMDYLQAGWPPHLIQQWLDLSDKQIADAMDYIKNHKEAVEAEYRQILQEAEENRRYWEEYNKERFAQIATAPVTPEKAAIRRKIQARKAELELV